MQQQQQLCGGGGADETNSCCSQRVYQQCRRQKTQTPADGEVQRTQTPHFSFIVFTADVMQKNSDVDVQMPEIPATTRGNDIETEMTDLRSTRSSQQI